jgi:DnaJ-class molecular chaperone
MDYSVDYYKILQIDPSAEPESVKAAYSCLAEKYHPDKNKSPNTLTRMQEINDAYGIIGNDAKRSQYDQARQRIRSSSQTFHANREAKMSCKAEISRTNPTLFVFLLDQSGSMSDPFGGQASISKASGVARAINRMLSNLVIRC